MTQKVPRYRGLSPASPRASELARKASLKKNTRCEIRLRRALRARGVTGYRIDVGTLPGRPDIVFRRTKLVVFCDGDFWHGRNLEERIRRLAAGHNAPYWVEKIRTNVARDTRQTAELQTLGFLVFRFWETDLLRDVDRAAEQITVHLQSVSAETTPVVLVPAAPRRSPYPCPDALVATSRIAQEAGHIFQPEEPRAIAYEGELAHHAERAD